MKKFLYSAFLIIIFLFVAVVLYLSTIGLETSKFNNSIVKKVEKIDPKIKLDLEKIKIKLDIKKIQLFLSTSRPKIVYQNINIPITEIKVYSKINKFFNSKIEITQIVFRVKKFEIQDIQKIAIRIKPSNFKTYLLNNINGGEIEKALFDLNIGKNFNLINYKVSGTVKEVDVKIRNKAIVKNINFNFKIDNDLTLINSVNANYEGIIVSNGSINLQREKGIEVQGKFDSLFNLNEEQLKKFLTKEKFLKENKIQMQGSLLHSFNLKINNNFKIIDYNYKYFDISWNRTYRWCVC